MSNELKAIESRREILFLYDIRMGNPNGDPDENRPRRLPDGRFYVTDVRLKRFVRDYLASTGNKILVTDVDDQSVTLTGRVKEHLKEHKKENLSGRELVDIILDSFIDARLFGSALAFKKEDEWEEEASEGNEGKKKSKKKGKGGNWSPIPKALTGPVQFNMGEVLHDAEEIRIRGTSVFSSAEEKTQGTFTDYAALRYALIAFNGIVNEHSATKTRMTSKDYDLLLRAVWNGVRSAGNTRTKVGQVPRLLISLEYKEKEEFQFGNLMDYVKVCPRGEKPEREWASPTDYLLDLYILCSRLKDQQARIEVIRYEKSPDIEFTDPRLAERWEPLKFDVS